MDESNGYDVRNVSQWCHNGATMVLQWRYEGIPRIYSTAEST
jgi:hypothetical protein